MTKQQTVRLTATIERKQEDLPRFAVVPAALVESWKLDGTTTVVIGINDVNVGRRSLVRWDDDRWFVSITQQDCRRLGVDTGCPVVLTLEVASEDLPPELQALLDESPEAKRAWERLTTSQRRMLREEVASAKQSSTRARRARRALS